MAFGPFTGGSSRGGVSQAKYGLASMFEGLARGLEGFAKLRAQSESEDKRLAHDDARTAADNAFRMNLERFHTQASADLQKELEAGRNAREERRDTVSEQHWSQQFEHQKAQEALTERHQRASEGLQARALEINAESKASLEEQRKQHAEEYKQQVEASKAAMARGDATTALKIADDMVQTPKLNYAKALEEYKALTKNGEDPDSQEQKDARIQLEHAKAMVNDAERKAAPLREKALKSIGYGEGGASTGKPAEDPMAAARDAYAKSLIGGTLNGKPIDAAAAADIAAKAPPAALQKFAPAQPAAKATTTDTGGGEFLAPTGEAAPQVAQASPPPAVTPIPSSPAQQESEAPQAPAAAATQQTAATDPSAQYQSIADKIKSDPESQGIVTTLNRLAESKEGPVADKMRRAAQIQLEQQFPDQDSNGFIDYYLDQNAQQSEIA